MYKFLYQMKENTGYKSTFLNSVEHQLNCLGLSELWLCQWYPNILPSASVFKSRIKQRLFDQYVQEWFEEINNNELYYNYRMFKTEFCFEKYLNILPANLVSFLVKYRTLNHRMPIQKGRFLKMNRSERVCLKCNSGDLGDEFHYLFTCSYCTEERKRLIKTYYWKRPNAIKYQQLLGSSSRLVLLKLVRFIRFILSEM